MISSVVDESDKNRIIEKIFAFLKRDINSKGPISGLL